MSNTSDKEWHLSDDQPIDRPADCLSVKQSQCQNSDHQISSTSPSDDLISDATSRKSLCLLRPAGIGTVQLVSVAPDRTSVNDDMQFLHDVSC